MHNPVQVGGDERSCGEAAGRWGAATGEPLVRLGVQQLLVHRLPKQTLHSRRELAVSLLPRKPFIDHRRPLVGTN